MRHAKRVVGIILIESDVHHGLESAAEEIRMSDAVLRCYPVVKCDIPRDEIAGYGVRGRVRMDSKIVSKKADVVLYQLCAS